MTQASPELAAMAYPKIDEHDGVGAMDRDRNLDSGPHPAARQVGRVAIEQPVEPVAYPIVPTALEMGLGVQRPLGFMIARLG